MATPPMPYIYGINPIVEALEHQRPIQKIYLQHGRQGGRTRQIYTLAKRQRVPVVNIDQRKVKQLVGDVRHQGAIALISPVDIRSLNDLIEAVPDNNQPFALTIVDRIQDPHNMGAIVRSAEVLGQNGILFSLKGGVPITDTVMKASAGAALHLPLYETHNLSQAIDRLRDKGLWIYGAALEGNKMLYEVDFDRPHAIIIGGEDKGIRSKLREKCDELFLIPQSGKTESLNASVAAGIIMAESSRQRQSAS